MATGDERLAEVNRELRGGNVKWGAFRATCAARGDDPSFVMEQMRARITGVEQNGSASFPRVRSSQSH